MPNEDTRYIKSVVIQFATGNDNNKLTFNFNGVEWDVEGKLYPRDVQFLNTIVELVKEHKR